MAIAFLSAKRSKDPNRQVCTFSFSYGNKSVNACVLHVENKFEMGCWKKNMYNIYMVYQGVVLPQEKLQH